MAKKILKWVGICAAVVLLAAAGLVGWLTVREYKPAPVEDLDIAAFANQTIAPGDSLTVLSQNTGYAGLGADSDFFMDGGADVAPTREQMETNLAGLSGQLTGQKADVYFLQEVDTDSSRTYGVNQSYLHILNESSELYYSSSYALNYSCDFVPFPWPPLGKVHSGLQSLSAFPVEKAQRIALPCPFSWPVRTANLKRCLLVSRLPVQGSDRQLVLVNLHLEAYDDGEGKVAQTKQLNEFLETEYEKGNYVIAGGDFNQIFPGSLEAYPNTHPDLWEPGVLTEEMLPQGFSYAYDLGTPSCRLLNQPYDPEDTGNTQHYVIDGFILSPNVKLEKVETLDLGFASSDHNPVLAQVVLEP